MNTAAAVIPLILGWILDRLLGDPPKLPHPVVAFGHTIALCERNLNHGRRRILKGTLTTILLTAAVYLLTTAILHLCRTIHPYVAVAVQTIGVFYCLAGTTLIREVKSVFQATQHSLDQGRRRLSRIVGRDTTNLNADQIHTAALETLSENLSDGVIAPLFWYTILGLPGMMTYKMINTLDSMIAYHTPRYEQFGRFAARLDDAANYIPARLTALLMICAAGKPRLWRFVRRYGPCHVSPNAGYPEAALAGILDCRFGGTHNYFGQPFEKPYIGTNPRHITPADAKLSITVNRRVEVIAVTISTLIILLLQL